MREKLSTRGGILGTPVTQDYKLGSMPEPGQMPAFDYLWGQLLGGYMDPYYGGDLQFVNRTDGTPIGPAGFGVFEGLQASPDYPWRMTDEQADNMHGFFGSYV